MTKHVRVRFAPSPTGGLHLGGVRTVLFNYLFAKAHKGDFILRIEDTDQSRFVAGAEEYIMQCLNWCGLTPDESPIAGGPHAPYRQSERKALYSQYAHELVAKGYAYYAFDTPEEIEQMRHTYRLDEHSHAQYDRRTRAHMRNSLTCAPDETKQLLANNTPYVVRIKMPENELIQLNDMIRGEITFDSNLVDDKVLLKADGMPTYHLAVVVDDYLMQISHAFRGEEWLPSAPVHVLLWKYLGWETHMPHWAHLPLILKPDGNGKLSKRDGDRLGFPVFAMDWFDAAKNEHVKGFREIGFLPQAFVNMLALLGWNDGSEQEIFSITELIEKFSIERVHKGGAKFDFEKAKWFNHQYLQTTPVAELATLVAPYIEEKGVAVQQEQLLQVIPLIKDRCSLLPDFWEHGHFFFRTPETVDMSSLRDKWNDTKTVFFERWCQDLDGVNIWDDVGIESHFNEAVAQSGIKKGEFMLPLRVMLVGGKYGPGVFQIAAVLGKDETIKRIRTGLAALQ